jgi:NAD(P)-dependent dehydrogenase (short-subunit alcohol dehydrogenase family)
MSKIILITGTSTGFGRLFTQTLAKEGHRVIAAMRGVNGKNAASAKELNALENVEVVEMDVTSEISVNAAVQTTLKKYGHIDILVNNAGVVGFGILEAVSIEQMKNLFEVNLFGLVRTYQAVLPSMRERKAGLIVNITSGFGLFAAPFVVPYNMSKFGAEALTEGIRHELRPFNIETVSILPGPFPTEIAGKAGFGPDKQDVVDAYGPDTMKSLEEFGGIMSGKIEEYKMNNQEVADALSTLVNMKDGTRPFQTVVNRIAEGVDQEYADSKQPYKDGMMKNMGWGNF